MLNKYCKIIEKNLYVYEINISKIFRGKDLNIDCQLFRIRGTLGTSAYY